MRYLAALVLTLSAGLGASQAQTLVPSLDQQGRKGEVARNIKQKAVAQFDATDEDKDGKLSQAELAKHSRYMAENFDKYDLDKDGALSWEEFVGHNRWPK